MTEEQREIITALATRLHFCRERVAALEMMNTVQDYDARLQQTIDYEIAVTEAREASRALDAARASFIPPL